MAIVLALLIVGWLIAFALGAQAGFEGQPAENTAQSPTQSQSAESVSSTSSYRKTASAS